MSYKLASSTWDEREIQAMQEVIATGNFTMGEKVRSFEKAFAEFFGSNYAVMSNSGSSANLLAVSAMRYRHNNNPNRTDIIVPAVSWGTTYYPIHQLGYRLKFVDVDLDTLNATSEAISEAIDDKTAGVFAVNLLGNPSELVQLRNLANEKGIFLIEDNCESMGATLEGKYAGTYGEIGTFSTFFSHHMSTMEGGVCLTDDPELAQIMISMRAHGWTRELPVENYVFNKTGSHFDDYFRFVLPGYNLRPIELEAAVGLVQLSKLPEFLKARRANANKFMNLPIASSSRYKIQKANESESSWFGFSLVLQESLTGQRDTVVNVLKESGIDSRPIVAGNFTKNPVLKHLNHAPIGYLPNAEKIDQDGLFVGNHHFELDRELELLDTVLSKI